MIENSAATSAAYSKRYHDYTPHLGISQLIVFSPIQHQFLQNIGMTCPQLNIISLNNCIKKGTSISTSFLAGSVEMIPPIVYIIWHNKLFFHSKDFAHALAQIM
jgi:hypothetical protein